MHTQAHILYSGMVQGVGFRYTVRRYALEIGLVGWVKNLPNGCVEILVDGDKEAIEQLIRRIEEYFQENIRNKEVAYQKSQENFFDFKITF